MNTPNILGIAEIMDMSLNTKAYIEYIPKYNSERHTSFII